MRSISSSLLRVEEGPLRIKNLVLKTCFQHVAKSEQGLQTSSLTTNPKYVALLTLLAGGFFFYGDLCRFFTEDAGEASSLESG